MQGTFASARARRALIVTCSYAADVEACRALCASVDRFVSDDFDHLVVVPRRDLPLFADLVGPRRLVVADDRFRPRSFLKLPLPSPRWRRILHLPRRNVYVTPYSAPVRGWIAQQVLKIAVSAAATADIVVHVDSDNLFIRPLTLDRLDQDGRARLYRDPVQVDETPHRAWQAAAGRLLALPSSTFYGGEYIDQVVVWRPEVVRAMIAHIEAVTKRRWYVTLARTPHFAEYVLYGVYADRVLGLDRAGLYADQTSLCHSRWSGAFESESDEIEFAAAVPAGAVACLIQSTIAVSPDRRARIFALVEREAARQDARTRG